MKFFTGRELKISIILILIGGLVAALISILVMRPPTQKVERDATVPQEIESYSLSDLLIPGEFKKLGPEGPFYKFKIREKWEDHQIEEFWKDPREISLDILEEENNIFVDSIFNETE